MPVERFEGNGPTQLYQFGQHQFFSPRFRDVSEDPNVDMSDMALRPPSSVSVYGYTPPGR